LDCDPEFVLTFAPLVDPEVEVWAKAAPQSSANAVAVTKSDLMWSLQKAHDPGGECHRTLVEPRKIYSGFLPPLLWSAVPAMKPPTFVSEAFALELPLTCPFSLPPAVPNEPLLRGPLLATPLADVPPTLVCRAEVVVFDPLGPAVPLALVLTELELPDTAPTDTPPLPEVTPV
jgi:hypothetical protein